MQPRGSKDGTMLSMHVSENKMGCNYVERGGKEELNVVT